MILDLDMAKNATMMSEEKQTKGRRRGNELGGVGGYNETYFACFRLRAIIFSAISVGIGQRPSRCEIQMEAHV